MARPRHGPTSDKWTRANEIMRRLFSTVLTKQLGFEHPALMRAAHHPAAPALIREALKIRADLYIAHREIALPAAAKAAARHNALHAFDAEDFHLGESFEPEERSYRQKLVRAFEEPYLRGCAYVTAASPGIAQAYATEYQIPAPTVVLNLFPREHAPPSATPSGKAQPAPSVYWFSQVIGPDRGLECAVRAIGRARSKPHLHLRGASTSSFVAKLNSIAEAEGAQGHVHILPLEAPSKLESLAAEYDVGLASEPGQTENSRILLSNKLFAYLLAGLPVALSNTPAHAAIARDLGSAAQVFAVNDPTALAAVLDQWLGNPEALALARQEAWTLGQQRYNWESERDKFVAIVEAALSTTNRSPKIDAHDS